MTMEMTLNLSNKVSGFGLVPASRTVAPSVSEHPSMSPSQTAALLPTEMKPMGSEVDNKEVTGKKQEQTSLVDDARQLAEKANTYLKMADTHLEFKVSEQTGRIVISVIESDTKEVVRQIPPESLNRFTNRMTQMRGLLFETTG